MVVRTQQFLSAAASSSLFFPPSVCTFLHGLQRNLCSGTWSTPSLSFSVLDVHSHVSHYFSLWKHLCPFLNMFSRKHHNLFRGPQLCPLVGPVEVAGESCVHHVSSAVPTSSTWAPAWAYRCSLLSDVEVASSLAEKAAAKRLPKVDLFQLWG